MNIFGFGKSNEESAEAPQAATVAQVDAPTAALTGAIPDGGLLIEQIVAWLQGAGYSAKVVTGTNGVQHIVSMTQGTPLNVFLGDRIGDRATSLNLASAFSTNGKFDISRMNEWNSTKRWSRAYYDSVNDPWMEMDISLSPGCTYAALDDQLNTWNTMLAQFINMYGLK